MKGQGAAQYVQSGDSGFSILRDGYSYDRTKDHVDIASLNNQTVQAAFMSAPLSLIYQRSKIAVIRAPPGTLGKADSPYDINFLLQY